MTESYPSPFHNQTDNMANIPVTPMMIEHLKATKPWVRFMSIICFIGCGFMILAGIAILLMPSAPGMGSGLRFLGLFYILFAILYIVPGYFLHQFASSIGHLMQGGGDVAIEAALGSQKSFWRFVGILTLVLICLYALFFVVMIMVGMGSAFR